MQVEQGLNWDEFVFITAIAAVEKKKKEEEEGGEGGRLPQKTGLKTTFDPSQPPSHRSGKDGKKAPVKRLQ